MSKMVKRIALLILVLLPVFACGELATPPRARPTPAEPHTFIEAVMLKGGEAVEVWCDSGLMSTSEHGDVVVIYCLKSY